MRMSRTLGLMSQLLIQHARWSSLPRYVVNPSSVRHGDLCHCRSQPRRHVSVVLFSRVNLPLNCQLRVLMDEMEDDTYPHGVAHQIEEGQLFGQLYRRKCRQHPGHYATQRVHRINLLRVDEGTCRGSWRANDRVQVQAIRQHFPPRLEKFKKYEVQWACGWHVSRENSEYGVGRGVMTDIGYGAAKA